MVTAPGNPMANVTKILDEATFKSRRFTLEYSVTSGRYVVKCFYTFPNEQTARASFEKACSERKPKAYDPKTPAPKKGRVKKDK